MLGMVIKWINQIVENIKKDVPIILYSKSAPERIDALRKSNAHGLSVSQEVDLPSLRRRLPSNYLPQGNLPELIKPTLTVQKQTISNIYERR